MARNWSTPRHIKNLIPCLVLALCLPGWPAGCSMPQDGTNGNTNGNQNGNTNGNQNDNSNGEDPGNGPGVGQILVEFDLTSGNTNVARALSGGGTEYGFRGVKDLGGFPINLTQIDVVMPDGSAVRASVDDVGRPSQILSTDDTALLLSYDSAGTTATVVFVGTDGATSRVTSALNPAARSAAQIGTGDLCALLRPFTDVINAVLAGCAGGAAAYCDGDIAQAIAALSEFCSSTLIAVVGVLDPSVGRGPSMGLPLGVVIDASEQSVTPGSGITLRGSVFGGTPPYLFNWDVLEGSPTLPPVTSTSSGTISTASVSLSAEGVYRIRLTVLDNNARVTFFDIQIVSVQITGALTVAGEAVVSVSDPFVVSLSAQAGGGAPPYAFAWSLDDGPGSVSFDNALAAETLATFTTGGNYILTIRVTDSLNDAVESSVPVSIVDPATSLAARIVFPPCGTSTQQDTCMALDGTLELQADVDNATSSAALTYDWDLLTGQNSASLSGADTATATVTSTGPDFETVVVQLTVTDQGDGEVARDDISIEVIPDLDLTVVILSPSSATLNQPSALIAQVNGAVGALAYEWEVDPPTAAEFGCVESDSGCDEDNPHLSQNVLLTPTVLGILTVRVSVTDLESGKTADASTMVSVSTFSVQITGGNGIIVGGDGIARDTISRSTLFSYSAILSGGAPDEVDYQWVVTKHDALDSLSVTLIDDTAAVLQLLASGDGVFDLDLTVTQSDDPTNFATNEPELQVTVACAEVDTPGAQAGLPQLAAVSPSDLNPHTVLMTCMDPNVGSQANRGFRWRQLAGPPAEDFTDIDTQSAKFKMPLSAPLGLDAFEFECMVEDLATRCEAGDTTRVYAEPIVQPTLASTQNVLVGSAVQLGCVQLSGYRPDAEGEAAVTFGWRQVDAGGAEILPPNRVENFTVDAGGGTLSFTAPGTPTATPLLFECRAVVEDPAVDLPGPFSTADRAEVTVRDFALTKVVRTGDSAPSGAGYDAINAGRLRLVDDAAAPSAPGTLVFASTLDAAPFSGLFRVDLSNLSTTAMVRQGDPAPVPGTQPSFGEIQLFDVNGLLDVAFISGINGVPTDQETQGVFLVPSGAAASEIAANGTTDVNPTGMAYCAFDDVGLDAQAAVSFIAQVDLDGDGCPDDVADDSPDGVYASSAGTTTAVAEVSDFIPGPLFQAVTFESSFEQLHANDAGAIIFAGQNSSEANPVFGAFIADAPSAVLDFVFVDDRAAASTGGVYDEALPADLGISSSGVVGYQADLRNLATSDEGLFTSLNPPNGTRILLNDLGSPAGFDFATFKKVAVNANLDLAFIATDFGSDKVLFYHNATGKVVLLRDEAGNVVRNGGSITDSNGLTLNIAELQDVQLNDAGTVVFSMTLSGGGSAILSATMP